MALIEASVFTTYLFCAACVFLLKYFIENRRYYINAFQIPGSHPLTIPILGDLVTFLRNRMEIPQTFLRMSRQYGGFYRIWLPECTVMVSKPDLLELVYNNSQLLDKTYHYDALKEILGETSLVTIDGAALDVDILDYPVCCDFIQNLDSWTEKSMFRACAPAGFSNFVFNICMSGWKMWKDLRKMGLDCRDIYDLKKKERADLVSAGKPVPNKYIFNLIRDQSSNPFRSTESEVKTTLFAALHTTSSLIGYTLLMLGLHPEIQDKVFEEDRQIQQELKGLTMEENDLNKYEYLQRVIKEVLRIFPPVPAIFRKVQEDTKIGKYTIPNGSTIGIGILSLHRNPEVYSNPNKFDPDRFLPENLSERSKYAYVPFSKNRRQCPGARYATNNALVLIASIVRDFKIQTKYENIEEIERYMKTCVALKDHNDYPISVQLRK